MCSIQARRYYRLYGVGMRKVLVILLLGSILTSCSLQQSKVTSSGNQMETNIIKSVTIGLPVPELEKATEWYREILGNPEIISPAPGVSELSLTSTSWLQLFQVEANQSNPTILRFESNDIKASHELALKYGNQVGNIETVPSVISYFEFRDPYGNMLSFYELLEK